MDRGTQRDRRERSSVGVMGGWVAWWSADKSVAGTTRCVYRNTGDGETANSRKRSSPVCTLLSAHVCTLIKSKHSGSLPMICTQSCPPGISQRKLHGTLCKAPPPRVALLKSSQGRHFATQGTRQVICCGAQEVLFGWKRPDIPTEGISGALARLGGD